MPRRATPLSILAGAVAGFGQDWAGLTREILRKARLRLLTHARARLASAFDSVHGGFGRAPKFPRPMDLQVLLRAWSRERRDDTLDMVRLTLDTMAAGGIYDHLGGGFARYSVDDRWLVPHFEKMLYDNALLADAYLDGFLVTRAPHYARIAAETCDYVLRDMADSEGGFHSAEDADSEGEEGKFYVWSMDEVQVALGADAAARFCLAYGLTREGNFEGGNILYLPCAIEQSAQRLGLGTGGIVRRAARIPSALAGHSRATRASREGRQGTGQLERADDPRAGSWRRDPGPPRVPEPCAGAASFLLERLRRGDGRLLHCCCRGEVKLDAYLDDYAYLIQALVTLYEADFDERWIDAAVPLAEMVLRHFHDARQGGFFFTADDHERLITRTKELHDGSVPGSNAMAATALIRLGKLTGRSPWLDAAQRAVASAARLMREVPEATAQMLVAADLLAGPTWELALLADPKAPDTHAILSALRQTYLPHCVVACRPPDLTPPPDATLNELFAGKTAVAGEPALYVCENYACQEPVHGTAAIRAAWQRLANMT